MPLFREESGDATLRLEGFDAADIGAEPIGAELRARNYTDIKFASVTAPTLEELGAEPAGAEARARQYTDQEILKIPPPPTLADLGGEPLGAESRARQYTDQEILKIPPFPTLLQLGGEPAGAETRSRQYTDSKISALPPPLTLSQLGGEPAGAETRARQYTDQQLNQTANWTNLSLLNGWLNFGSEYHPASYYLNPRTSEIIFRGTVRAGTNTIIAKNLSIAPSKIQAFSIVSSALPSIGYVIFYPNGDIISSVSGANAFIYFDGCRYFR